MDNIVKSLFLVIGGIISGVFFIMALYYFHKTKKEKKYTCKTYGKIINNIMREQRELNANSNYITRRYWYSLCEYTVGETKCVRETNIGTFQPKYEVGQTVNVYYNPNNCHESYIDGHNNSKIKGIVCFVLGIILVIFMYCSMKFFI